MRAAVSAFATLYLHGSVLLSVRFLVRYLKGHTSWTSNVSLLYKPSWILESQFVMSSIFWSIIIYATISRYVTWLPFQDI